VRSTKLLEGEHKRVFAVLQEKVQQLGVSGLSSEEKQQYLTALGARGRRVRRLRCDII
jgi:hypothetical protein